MVRILFVHPDLGIGGAERLVVDAGLALKEQGHDISFLTNHHSSNHCFKETRDGTFPVSVVGDWLPRRIFGRFYAFCAYIRMIYAAFYTTLYLSRQQKIDVIFCDQISVGIPILRLAHSRPKVIFYCHYPDQLLTTRTSIWKSLYRAPLDFFEEYTIGKADTTLVNSKFTLRVFRETFKRLEIVPQVLYPSLNTKFFDEMQKKLEQQEPIPLPQSIPTNSFIYLDINRYERKKNHELAIRAFQLLQASLAAAEWKRCRLIVAGGYDVRVPENVEHFEELQKIAKVLELGENIIFLRSPNDEQKFALLSVAHCLVYTPDNEHFGIVPLEGMYMSKPVIAVNSGGPTETIVNNSTGFLCDKNVNQFAEAMLKIYKDDGLCERMGVMGRKRVQQRFSFEAFANRLDNLIIDLLQQTPRERTTREKEE